MQKRLLFLRREITLEKMSLKKVWIPTSTVSSIPASSGQIRTKDKQEGIHCLLEKGVECPLELYCSQCSSLLLDPQQVTCCGNNYCMQCLEEISAYNSPCIQCGAISYFSYGNKSLKSKIESIRVHCPNYDKGCVWIGSLRNVTEHCCLSEITDNSGNYCRFVREKDAELKCPHCSQSFSSTSKLQRHTEIICDLRPFTCQYCNKYSSSFRDVMKNHRSMCTLAPKSCPNKCGECVLQVDLENHMQNDCSKKNIRCEFAPLGCQELIPRSDYLRHSEKGAVHHLNLVVRKLGEMAVTEAKMKEEMAKLKEQCQHLERKVRELEEKSQAEESTYSIVPISHQKYLRAPENVLAEFTMKNVSKLKKENSTWSSPPFYTSQKGHRLYLQVIVNGHGKYKGKYISIFIYRTIGEFDDQLLVPFQGTLALQMISEKQKVPSYRVVISIENDASQVYANVLATSYSDSGSLKAIPDFANLSILSSYLNKDSLVFRVVRLNI